MTHIYQKANKATYIIDGQEVNVVLCWEGRNPEDDPDRFYDIHDSNTGICLNVDGPWYDDGEGVPTIEEVSTLVIPDLDLTKTNGGE